MAVKMRLRRVGAKKQPAYRVVVADARCPRDGRFIEIVGHYNPLTEPATIFFESEKVFYWLKNGAQPTDVVVRLLKKAGVWAVYTGEATEIIAPAAPVAAPVIEAPAVAIVEEPALPAVVEEPAVPAVIEEVAAVEEPAAIEEVAEVAAEEKPAENAE